MEKNLHNGNDFNSIILKTKLKDFESAVFLVDLEDNNLLDPKVFKIFNLVNVLKEQNKLGNIIDFTNIFEKTNKSLDNMCTIMNSYSVPDNVSNNLINFYEWFMKTVWDKKREIFMSVKNDQNIYKNEYKNDIKKSSLILSFIILNVFVYLNYHTKCKFVILSLLVNIYYHFRNTY